MRHLITTAVVCTLVAMGCGDTPTATGPTGSDRGGTSAGISDGSHEIDGQRGNEDFFFLPPLVKEPTTATYKDRPFHPGMQPRVSVCLLDQARHGCEGTPVREFAPGEVMVSLTAKHYRVNWNTKESALNVDRMYRIQIFVQKRLLGYADIDVGSNGSEIRHVDADHFIGLVDGRTLPIIFRIEEGALCTFKPCTEVIVTREEGGTFLAADEGAGIAIPPGALPLAEVMLTIERKPVPPGSLCVEDPATPGFVFQQYEGCYEFRTDPKLDDPTLIPDPDLRGFREPVVVGVCYTGVPPGLEESIELLKFDPVPGIQRLQSVDAPFITCSDFTGTPTTTTSMTLLDAARFRFAALTRMLSRWVGPKPLYAVDGGLGCLLPVGSVLSHFFWGLPITATKIAGDEQTAPVGSIVTAPELSIKTAHADHSGNVHPVNGAPVRFRVVSGGGSLVGPLGAVTELSVVSAAKTKVVNGSNVLVNGIATLPDGWSWRLGTTEGLNALEATGPFVGGLVTFTATAEPEGPRLNFVSLSAGGSFTCGVDDTGATYCWGYNGSTGQALFQLGIATTSHTCGTFDCQPLPALVSAPASGAVSFSTVHAGGWHTCALTATGVAYCWGYNGRGELGDGTTSRTYRPKRVQTALTFKQIAAGGIHTCGITEPGQLYCWGGNSHGVLGDGTLTDRSAPTLVSPPGSGVWQQVSAGTLHTCALSSVGDVYCWGMGEDGQLGNSTVADRTLPTAIIGTGTVQYSHVSAGVHHSCAVTSDGGAHCWGRNDVGQLGSPDTTWSRTPRQVAKGSAVSFTRVAAGGFFTCALTSSGSIQCWGRNDTGELGIGTFTTGTNCELDPGGIVPCSRTPVTVSGGRSYRDVSAGARNDHVCGLTTNTSVGDIYCWGRNTSGQLGNGQTLGVAPAPVRVASP